MKIEKAINIYLGYIWFLENIKERKKKNDFLMFSYSIKKILKKIKYN